MDLFWVYYGESGYLGESPAPLNGVRYFTTSKNKRFMRSVRFRLFGIVLGLISLRLVGCDSPSAVGLDTLDDLANAPNRVQVTFNPAQTAGLFEDITGQDSPVLTGNVTERGKLAGISLEAIGFMDFLDSSSRTNKFKDGPITKVDLILKPTYAYGDTSAVMNVGVYDMPKEWTATNAKYDSLFTAGDLVATSADFKPNTKKDVVIALPSTWYTPKSDIIRDKSGDFADDLHGFQLKSAKGNAIVGFDYAQSYFRVVSGTDTLKFASSTTRVHTYVKRSGSPMLATGQHYIQDDTGDGILISPDLEALKAQVTNGTQTRFPAAINAVQFKVSADTTISYSSPGFARPVVKRMIVYGIKKDKTKAVLATATFSKGYFIFSNGALTNEVQKQMIGKGTYEKMILTPYSGAGSVNGLIWYDMQAIELLRPKFFVTFIDTN